MQANTTVWRSWLHQSLTSVDQTSISDHINLL